MNTTPKKIQALEKVIAAAAGLTRADLYSARREREVVDARQMVWVVASEHMGCTVRAIAGYYGVHYTTCKHGVNRMREMRAYKQVMKELQSKHPQILANAFSDAASVSGWDFKVRKGVDSHVDK